MVKKINLKTADGVKIVGNFYKTENQESPAVILLHMLPSKKEGWDEFAKLLNFNGFQCLAIDLRGHGESEAGPDGFITFNDNEHKASIYDVECAVKFFTDRLVPFEKISFIGASIGANLSLQFQSQNQEIKASVLLSPGLDYKGIAIENMAKKISDEQSIFLVAGGNNDEYSTETVRKIYGMLHSKNKEIVVFKNAGHGTTIFKEEPELMNQIISWLKNIYL